MNRDKLLDKLEAARAYGYTVTLTLYPLSSREEPREITGQVVALGEEYSTRPRVKVGFHVGERGVGTNDLVIGLTMIKAMRIGR